MNSDGSTSNLPMAMAPGKKRRGLTLEDIEAFKSQITPLIDEVSDRVNAQMSQLNDTKSSLKTHSTRIVKLEQEQKYASEDILNIRKGMDEMKAFINSEDQKLV